MDESEFLEEFEDAEGPNKKYRLIRQKAKELRQDGFEEDENDFLSEEFREFLSELNEDLDGDLLVFAANDFGHPYAFYPEGSRKGLLDEFRTEMLEGKYRKDEELNELRKKILDFDEKIHLVMVAEHRGNSIKYHAPGGTSDETNALTARDYIGLIDWVLCSTWKGPDTDDWDDLNKGPDKLGPNYLREVFTY